MILNSFLSYLQFEKRSSPHTLAAYRNDLIQFQNFIIEQFQIEIQIATHQNIRQFILELSENKVSARSINRKIATLRAFFKYLLKKNIISKDPTIKLKALKTAKVLPKYVEKSELNFLLDDVIFPENFIGIRNKLILELLYGTGIRLSELVGMKNEDVQIGAETIKVTGKRNKQRVIPIGKHLVEEINTYNLARQNLFGASNKNQSFIITEKNEPVYPRLVQRLVSHYLKTYTNSEKISPHVLRHSYATHMLEKGANLNAIKDLLGHSSLAATQVYTHNSIEKLKSAFELAHPKA